MFDVDPKRVAMRIKLCSTSLMTTNTSFSGRISFTVTRAFFHMFLSFSDTCGVPPAVAGPSLFVLLPVI